MTHGSLLLVLAAIVLTGLGAPAAAQTPGTCTVTRVTGQAEVSARGAGTRPAALGLGLGRNATLRTQADGRVTLSCADGLTVVVGPASEIDLQGILDGGSQPFGLRLMRGIAGFLTSGTAENGVQVRTPSAVAAVRSTQWAMQVEDRASAVFTRSGTVFVLAEGGEARLGPGDGVDVTPSGDVGPVTRWGQARIDRFDALLGPDW